MVWLKWKPCRQDSSLWGSHTNHLLSFHLVYQVRCYFPNARNCYSCTNLWFWLSVNHPLPRPQRRPCWHTNPTGYLWQSIVICWIELGGSLISLHWLFSKISPSLEYTQGLIQWCVCLKYLRIYDWLQCITSTKFGPALNGWKTCIPTNLKQGCRINMLWFGNQLAQIYLYFRIVIRSQAWCHKVSSVVTEWREMSCRAHSLSMHGTASGFKSATDSIAAPKTMPTHW